MVHTDQSLLDALDSTIEAGRRLATLTEHVLARAVHGPLLTEHERKDAANELGTAIAGFEQLETLSLMLRQKLRPM